MSDSYTTPVDSYTIRGLVEETRASILNLANSIDVWFESLKEIAKFVNSDVPFDKYEEFVDGMNNSLIELANAMTYAEDKVDELLAKMWFVKLMDLENLWGDFVIKTGYLGDAVKNVAEGCFPQNTVLNIPKNWRETKEAFGKGSNIF